MNVRFTRHARQRMTQRKIKEDAVLETLKDPDDLLMGDSGELIAYGQYWPSGRLNAVTSRFVTMRD